VSAPFGVSDGEKVGYIGNGAANYVTINNISEPSVGTYTLTFAYCLDGSRTFDISVNGGTGTAVALTGTSWTTPASHTMRVNLTAGANTIRFYNKLRLRPRPIRNHRIRLPSDRLYKSIYYNWTYTRFPQVTGVASLRG
jgi:hypothetical protein